MRDFFRPRAPCTSSSRFAIPDKFYIQTNLLSNAPDAAQSVQKRRQLVIESSDESDARTGDVDGGDKDIGADGRVGIDHEDHEDEDANDCL